MSREQEGKRPHGGHSLGRSHSRRQEVTWVPVPDRSSRMLRHRHHWGRGRDTCQSEENRAIEYRGCFESGCKV